MSIRIVPYTAEHEKAVRAFNDRLAAAHLDNNLYSTRFPTSHIPTWLPKQSGCDLFQEYFVAVDDQSVVRGGYILKRQPFLLKGNPLELAAYRLPISEGIIEHNFMPVGVSLYLDALRRHPHLWGLGGGGYHTPIIRFLLKAEWKTVLVPFWFRVVHPSVFLRNITFLRTSSARRRMLDFLGYSGLGWLGIKTLHSLKSKYHQPARVTCETVDEFSDWADDVWNDCKDDYSFIAVRDRQILNVSYPATDPRFIRLKVMRDGKVLGWAVLLDTRLSGHKHFGNMRLGSLVDCFASPADALAVAIAARETLQRRGVDLIVSNQSHATWGKALKAAGFLSGPSNFIFATSPPLTKLLKASGIQDGDIHLNRGDGDGPIHL